MPINLNHGASPSTLLMAGYAAGVGRRKQREQDRADAMQARAWDWQADQARRMQDQQNRFALVGIQQTAQRKRDEFQAEQAAKRDRERFGFRRALEDQEAGHRRDLLEQESIQKGLRDGTLKYTLEQKRQLSRLEEAEGVIESSEEIDDQQREHALAEIRRRRRLIRPIETPEDERPKAPGDLWAKSTVYINPDTGRPAGEGEWGVPMALDPETGVPTAIRGYPYQEAMNRHYGVDAAKQQETDRLRQEKEREKQQKELERQRDHAVKAEKDWNKALESEMNDAEARIVARRPKEDKDAPPPTTAQIIGEMQTYRNNQAAAREAFPFPGARQQAPQPARQIEAEPEPTTRQALPSPAPAESSAQRAHREAIRRQGLLTQRGVPTGRESRMLAPGISAEEFSVRWARLRPGETLVGPDGRTYRKQ